MNRTIILALAAASLSVAAPASAQTWDGWYLGVNAGYDFGNAKADTSVAGTGYFAPSSITSINSNGHQSLHPDGITGGAQGGFDTESDGVVWGAVADFDALDGHDSASTTVVYPCCSPSTYTISSKEESNWLATLRLRVGLDWDNFLIYATGGGAWTDVHGKYGFTDTFGQTESAKKSSIETGWTIGGGVELPVAGNWTIGAEFLHADFGTMTTSGTLSAGSNTFTHKVYVRDDIVRGTINFRL